MSLVLFVHPQCPCTRATIGELARIVAQCQGRLETFVLVFKPAQSSQEWEQTALCQEARAIPGVRVLSDADGREARRFAAKTSGQVALFDAAGRLVFSGGITGSRGHSGDNAGRTAVVSLVNGAASERDRTFVFGCSLLNPEPDGKAATKCVEEAKCESAT